MAERRSTAIFLAGINIMTCCESSSVGICAKAGSMLCLLLRWRSSLPAPVKQWMFWGVIGCSHLSFLQHVLHNYFASETVPLPVVMTMMIMMLIIFFIASCFTTSADTLRRCLSGGQ